MSASLPVPADRHAQGAIQIEPRSACGRRFNEFRVDCRCGWVGHWYLDPQTAYRSHARHSGRM